MVQIRRPKDKAGGSPTIGRRVSGEIETVGVAPVPGNQLISDAGDIIIPFTFVMLVDWLYVQRRRTPAAVFFQHPRRLADRVVPSAIVAVAVWPPAQAAVAVTLAQPSEAA